MPSYDDLGPADGVPVLLIHGHPFNRSMWAPQAEALRGNGYRPIIPDLLGYGERPAESHKTDFSDFSCDLVGLLDRLGVARAVVGGLSMGGQIAMDFHARYPERVSALILCDTSPAAETAEGKVFRNAVADRLLAEGMDGYAAEVIGKMIAPRHVTGQPEVAAHVLGMMRGTAPAGAAAALRGRAERPDYRESLRGVRVPALIVVGAEDTYTPVDEAERMRDLIPGATLEVVGDAAHLPNLEQPEAVNRILLRFLGAATAA